jgi:outer membrane protein
MKNHPASNATPASSLLRMISATVAASMPMAAVAELSDDPLLGAGLRTRPAYDGSASQRTELVPVLRQFGSPWFARSTQGVLEGGVRVEFAPGLHAGAQLAYEPGRQSRESDFLTAHGVADIGRGASVGLQLEWDHVFGPMPISVLTRLRKHTDVKRGTQADMRLSAGIFHSGPVSAGAFAQGIWADARSVGSLYGVTAQEAATTGLPAFTPASGLLSASGGLLWSVDLGHNWVVLGSLESRRLRGDAAQSPLAERTSNYYVTVGIAYRH